MTVYECDQCKFKTDDLEFMKVHDQCSDHMWMVD